MSLKTTPISEHYFTRIKCQADLYHVIGWSQNQIRPLLLNQMLVGGVVCLDMQKNENKKYVVIISLKSQTYSKVQIFT